MDIQNDTVKQAVEAGARAASPHAFDNAFWIARGAPDHHQKHAQANALKHAEAVLRAALPILAGDPVAYMGRGLLEDLNKPSVEYLNCCAYTKTGIWMLDEDQRVPVYALATPATAARS